MGAPISLKQGKTSRPDSCEQTETTVWNELTFSCSKYHTPALNKKKLKITTENWNKLKKTLAKINMQLYYYVCLCEG